MVTDGIVVRQARLGEVGERVDVVVWYDAAAIDDTPYGAGCWVLDEVAVLDEDDNEDGAMVRERFGTEAAAVAAFDARMGAGGGGVVSSDPMALLVNELRRRGVEADYYHTGGGVFCCRVLGFEDASMDNTETDAIAWWLFGTDGVWGWSCDTAVERVTGGGHDDWRLELETQGYWAALEDTTPIATVADAVIEQLAVGHAVASTGCEVIRER